MENPAMTLTASKIASVILALSALSCGIGCSTPTGPSSPVAGKWSGAAPDGMIVDATGGFCPRAWDLELNFTSSSAGDIGTATTRLRETPCADVLNQVNAYTLHKGSVTADSITFEFGNGAKFIATFAGSRMTGTFTTTADFPQSGHFVVNRQ